jgi:hypothetical protein
MAAIRRASFACVVLAILAGGPGSAFLTAAEGRVHGTVVDESGGVLPGVTVVATSSDGRVVATVSNEAGRYLFSALPPGTTTLTFQLEGFSDASLQVDVKGSADIALAPQRLTVAPRSETVLVEGKAPVAPPPVTARLPPPPPPPPAVVPVPEHDRDSICGPAKAAANPESLGIIHSRRYGGGDNGLYAKDDQILIDGGTLSGLEVGRNVVARRTFVVSGDRRRETGEHTSGVVQIVAAGERASVAVVIYTCDEIMRGDRLAAFTPEPVHGAEPAGTPAYDRAARILFADSGQLVGAPRRFLVIDRGGDHGIHVGQRLTLFRRSRFDGNPSVVGDAVVVAVRGDSATIRVESAVDAIAFGDLAAPHSNPQSSP